MAVVNPSFGAPLTHRRAWLVALLALPMAGAATYLTLSVFHKPEESKKRDSPEVSGEARKPEVLGKPEAPQKPEIPGVSREPEAPEMRERPNEPPAPPPLPPMRSLMGVGR